MDDRTPNPLFQLTYDPALEALGNEFYDPVNAAIFPQYILRWRNNAVLSRLGIEAKDVSDRQFQGSIIQLSANAAQVLSENEEQQGIPPGLSNIKLNLLAPNQQGEPSEDIYAKVIEKPAEPNNFYIHLTYKPPDVAAKLNSLYKLMTWTAKNKNRQ